MKIPGQATCDSPSSKCNYIIYCQKGHKNIVWVCLCLDRGVCVWVWWVHVCVGCVCVCMFRWVCMCVYAGVCAYGSVLVVQWYVGVFERRERGGGVSMFSVQPMYRGFPYTAPAET